MVAALEAASRDAIAKAVVEGRIGAGTALYNVTGASRAGGVEEPVHENAYGDIGAGTAEGSERGLATGAAKESEVGASGSATELSEKPKRGSYSSQRMADPAGRKGAAGPREEKRSGDRLASDAAGDKDAVRLSTSPPPPPVSPKPHLTTAAIERYHGNVPEAVVSSPPPKALGVETEPQPVSKAKPGTAPEVEATKRTRAETPKRPAAGTRESPKESRSATPVDRAAGALGSNSDKKSTARSSPKPDSASSPPPAIGASLGSYHGLSKQAMHAAEEKAKNERLGGGKEVGKGEKKSHGKAGTTANRKQGAKDVSTDLRDDAMPADAARPNAAATLPHLTTLQPANDSAMALAARAKEASNIVAAHDHTTDPDAVLASFRARRSPQPLQGQEAGEETREGEAGVLHPGVSSDAARRFSKRDAPRPPVLTTKRSTKPPVKDKGAGNEEGASVEPAERLSGKRGGATKVSEEALKSPDGAHASKVEAIESSGGGVERLGDRGDNKKAAASGETGSKPGSKSTDEEETYEHDGVIRKRVHLPPSDAGARASSKLVSDGLGSYQAGAGDAMDAQAETQTARVRGGVERSDVGLAGDAVVAHLDREGGDASDVALQAGIRSRETRRKHGKDVRVKSVPVADVHKALGAEAGTVGLKGAGLATTDPNDAVGANDTAVQRRSSLEQGAAASGLLTSGALKSAEAAGRAVRSGPIRTAPAPTLSAPEAISTAAGPTVDEPKAVVATGPAVGVSVTMADAAVDLTGATSAPIVIVPSAQQATVVFPEASKQRGVF